MEENKKEIIGNSSELDSHKLSDQKVSQSSNSQMDVVNANRPRNVEHITQDTVGSPSLTKQADNQDSVLSNNPGAPKKMGTEKKKPSKTNFLIGLLLSGVLLFVIFIVLMVLMISRAGANNPVMQSFGLDPAGMKQFLLTVISFSFGFLSIIFFVLMIIGLFRLISAKKSDKETRNKGVKMTLLNLIPFIFIVFIWFVLYGYISNIPISVEQVVAEVVVVSPEDITSLSAPVEITFSAENVAKALAFGGLNIDAMNWDLDGDGLFEMPVGAEPTVSHLYNRRGSFNVSLQVHIAGEEDFRDPYTKLIVIEDAAFDTHPSNGFAPLEVSFDASGLIPKGFKVDSLDWDFDSDGIYELEGPDNLKPTYTFDKIGSYNVHLRVLDQQNNVENYYKEVDVVPSDTPLLSAKIDATPDFIGAVPLQIRFDASGSESVKGKIIGYEWDFGDGSNLQSGKSVSYIFNDAGIYDVTLTVKEDSGKTAITNLLVTAKSVSSIPEAVISSDPNYDTSSKTLNIVLPITVQFSAGNSKDEDDDIIDYEWDFDSDGVIDQRGKNTEFTFDTSGTYEVMLTVTDSEGQTSSSSIKVIVEEPGVKAIITAVPEEGTAPLTVDFDGSSSTSFVGSIVSYEWDFGDDSPKTITGASVSHKYNKVGTYDVLLSVLTNKSESAKVSKTIFVREIPLRACFTPSRTNGNAPLGVTFNPMCSTGSVSTYTWDFGDGDESNSRKPTHTFENPGNYTVTLEVADDKNNVNIYTDVIVAEGEVK